MAAWLLACCALVFAIVVVGGITRLTQSGLSIVEWQPLVGAVPPLDEGAWRDTFARYRATPEFRLRNFGMTLEGFKRIFWWEYAHRLLGRVIGVAFLVPFLYFLARGAISRPIAWRLAGIFALGAFQGALGWFMVKSGLVDDPHVRSLRLAAHLGTAAPNVTSAALLTTITIERSHADQLRDLVPVKLAQLRTIGEQRHRGDKANAFDALEDLVFLLPNG